MKNNRKFVLHCSVVQDESESLKDGIEEVDGGGSCSVDWEWIAYNIGLEKIGRISDEYPF